MAKNKIEEPKIFKILRKIERGIPVIELTKKPEATEKTFNRCTN